MKVSNYIFVSLQTFLTSYFVFLIAKQLPDPVLSCVIDEIISS